MIGKMINVKSNNRANEQNKQVVVERKVKMNDNAFDAIDLKIQRFRIEPSLLKTQAVSYSAASK